MTSSSVFISYSRRNSAFATRLYHDLKRAAVDAWLDRSDIPLSAARWRPEVQAAIAKRACLLLLASPESGCSAEVAKELAEAERLGKTILALHIGGEFLDLPEAWRERSIDVDIRAGYWDRLANLLRQLNVTQRRPASLTEIVSRGSMVVRAAAAELTGEESLLAGGREYLALPVEPSGYAMSWLIAPAEAPLAPPSSLAVLLKFAGLRDKGGTAVEVLEFLRDRGQGDMWLVNVEGPIDEARYDLPLSSPHVWEDAVRIAVRAMQLPVVKGKELHLFIACPATLIYAVAGQIREMGRHFLYQLNYQNVGPRYCRVLGPRA